MIYKKWKYKELDFTCSNQKYLQNTFGYSYIIRNMTMQPGLRTDYFDIANYHGTYTSETLSTGRTYNFECTVIANDMEKATIAWNKLILNLQPEANPGSLNRGFYPLYMTDGQSVDKFVYAKVIKLPDPNFSGKISKTFEFTFSLYSETEKVFSTLYNNVTGSIGYHGGFTLSTPLPKAFSGYVGYISCNNLGNWNAPVNIKVLGEVDNPKIINITNGNKYRIEKTTSDLVFNNINLNNNPTERLVVTDSGVSIKEYRNSGAGIYLDKGDNSIIVLADSFVGSPIVTINRYNTYLY